MQSHPIFSKIYSVHFIAEHSSSRTGSWTRLEDTDTIAKLHCIPAGTEEEAIALCIRILKSKNRRSKYFRIVRVVTTHQTVEELIL